MTGPAARQLRKPGIAAPAPEGPFDRQRIENTGILHRIFRPVYKSFKNTEIVLQRNQAIPYGYFNPYSARYDPAQEEICVLRELPLIMRARILSRRNTRCLTPKSTRHPMPWSKAHM
ncbi:hypothetical protein ACFQFQ_14415 [Sulfitobacter porphyrae]|uniref:Uncharacterized protein n=1 Tax=Sulfitobacter porphyrae TaxID=1246864 RepID=A0ABW2B5V6_9RHOB